MDRENRNRTDGEKLPMLTGVFRNRQDAEEAYNDLVKHGYSRDDITLIMSEETRQDYFDEHEDVETGSKALEGTGAGASIGGVIGAAAGIIAAVGTSIVVPGLGIAIAGPIAGGLAGAGAGGITGGLIGALVGAGIPEEQAKLYKEEIDEGAIVVGVRPHNKEHVHYLENEWSRRADHIYG